ncbi:ferredoxin-thioredoxin reductase catalytic chain, chloroplastic isoform X1 [Capsicum annuum]|uniref:ferredoxin-thioredoxin reductase catalytic chain, chloroplastic isoform X1 n=1 Tax=Capsicum annuum TaxID=4072 RepID=UPI001FB153E0|nr:ferredoxin-thioredoxin reductase catalytic chain, chloroplastic isoform X1 [Capsicum annuum]
MGTLQASTSYSIGFGISSLAALPKPSTRRCVTVAKMEPSEKSVEVMRKFSEQYARRSGTYFCMDKGVTSVVIKGLAEHKDTLGAPLCPCRHYDDKAAEAQQGFWNCPCVPMRERQFLWRRLRKQQQICDAPTPYTCYEHYVFVIHVSLSSR